MRRYVPVSTSAHPSASGEYWIYKVYVFSSITS